MLGDNMEKWHNDVYRKGLLASKKETYDFAFNEGQNKGRIEGRIEGRNEVRSETIDEIWTGIESLIRNNCTLEDIEKYMHKIKESKNENLSN